MGWRRDEVWLPTELSWFREQPGAAARSPGLALLAPGGGAGIAIPYGLAASRRRRAARRQRRRSRKARAAALVVGSSAVLPLGAHRLGGGAGSAQPLVEDPPSLTIRPSTFGIDVVEAPTPERRGAAPAPRGKLRARRLAAAALPAIEWNRATAQGLHYAGSLAGGTQLPLRGPDWVTWNPVDDAVPNAPYRLYGHERTIRAILSVTAAYRAAHPEAARVVVGDISFREGGPMNEHVSHQNGLDVDVYYPRRDGAARAPGAPDQVDRALAQDLLDRFLAAGAQVVFVGYSTGLHGAPDVVVPYPNHENHMHVRFPLPAG